jgi:glycosyltransferase involved in cell wall biosynthesis
MGFCGKNVGPFLLEHKLHGKFLSVVRSHLRGSAPYVLARKVKRRLKKSLRAVDAPERKVISLKPEASFQGDVLLSYIIDPFLLKPGEPVSQAHTHHWESLQMARTFVDLGYGVDVISYENNTFVPQKDYAFFIDARWNLERLAPLINRDCMKIMHIDTAHMLFQDSAELSRLLALQWRRGITLRPRRFEMPNWAIEHADCATMLGNEFTISTYKYANKPIYRIPISTPVLYPWVEEKDFETCRKSFLWLGSGGMVHKGLDLVLEAFTDIPEYHLIVCGPVQAEKDFEKAFYRELYHTPNIHTVGWVDVSSSDFIEITRDCIGLVYPSCSEGGGGSCITCMHAGLIPIVSYESSVDVTDDFGIVLSGCSIEEIKDSLRRISNLPIQKLKLMSRRAWEFARANHTKEKFTEEYRKVISQIIMESRVNQRPNGINVSRS